jgi:23S rRNA (uracil1939-C5)-methyltransferase
MRPADFAALVGTIAGEEGCPPEAIVLGGDHLGPNPWRDRPAEAAMAEAVMAHVGKATPVADLFAGIGTFTVRLAERAPVTAVESDDALLKALEEAAKRGRGLKPVTTRRRDLFQNPLVARELDGFGAVVFDPPAAGARAQAEQIALSKVKTVVAVSCNPATLARDARILIDGGYRLTGVAPIDQFLFSAEIEAVAAFSR